jgi:signal transduction histidine kinase
MRAWLDRLTIPQRLLLANTLASSSALLIAGATLALLDGRQTRTDLLGRRGTDAEMVAIHSRSALLFDDPASAIATLAVLKVKRDIENACIYTRTGRLFAAFVSRDSPCAPAPALPGPDHRFAGGRLFVARPIVVEGEQPGIVVIESNLEELVSRRQRIFWSGLWVSLVAFAIGLGISWRYQRSVSRPLLELTGTAQSVSRHRDYATRATGGGPGEIGMLVDTFNEMLGQIQQRDQELTAAKTDLERRVAERTLDLNRELGVRQEAEEEVRRLNTALGRQLEEVTALNQEIESFSYSVSHDLRAPLRHVSGFVDLLRERAGATLDDTCQRYLRVIAGGAAQMGCLIDDLLSFSRMSRLELAQSDVSLSELVEEVRIEAERGAGERPIEWLLHPLPRVRGDRAMLRVVFGNLLSNAVKYSKPVAAPRIEVGCRPGEDGLLTVFVRDNGVGFDMKYAGKLFGVFQRLHRAEDFEGTGIGLATVKRIVSRHGGNVWAESEMGRGSTFYVSLAEAEGV